MGLIVETATLAKHARIASSALTRAPAAGRKMDYSLIHKATPLERIEAVKAGLPASQAR